MFILYNALISSHVDSRRWAAEVCSRLRARYHPNVTHQVEEWLRGYGLAGMKIAA